MTTQLLLLDLRGRLRRREPDADRLLSTAAGMIPRPLSARARARRQRLDQVRQVREGLGLLLRGHQYSDDDPDRLNTNEKSLFGGG
jgi:hypothetical protein